LQVLRSLAYDQALAQAGQEGSWASPTCPVPTIFEDPWVKENFVLAYAMRHGRAQPQKKDCSGTWMQDASSCTCVA
jgi:hypothetical protein